MPFELGLDLGCRTFGGRSFSKKQCLILEKERYRYQKVLSDISGNDIRAHGGESQTLISEVRNWIKVVDQQKIPGGNRIWLRFNEFLGHLDHELSGSTIRPKTLKVSSRSSSSSMPGSGFVATLDTSPDDDDLRRLHQLRRDLRSLVAANPGRKPDPEAMARLDQVAEITLFMIERWHVAIN